MSWRPTATKEELFRALLNEDSIILYDTETTGFSPEKCRIIQIAAIKYAIVNGELVEQETYERYIRQPFPLPEKIVELTGITNEHLSKFDFEEDVVDDIYNFMSSTNVLAGHNIKKFDMKFLEALFVRYGYITEYEYELDTLEMARDLLDAKEPKKLGEIAKNYGFDAGLSFHNALDDVRANARILKFFIEKYKEKEAEYAEIISSKKQPVPYQLAYWKGYRGQARVYIETNMGSFYYDTYSKTWNVNLKNNENSIEAIDMDFLRREVLALAKCNDEAEMSKLVAKAGRIKK